MGTSVDPPLRDTVVHGVSLASYAQVQAALAEGFDLDAALTSANVDPSIWEDAKDAWSDRLVENLEHDGPLEVALDELIVEAQDRYARRVPPLDEDLQAWLDFVRRWSADPEPLQLLGRLGLRSSDLARLHRRWSRLLAQDPAAARRAMVILGQEPGEMPEVHPEPAAPPPTGSVARQAIDELDDDDDDDAERQHAEELIFEPLPGETGVTVEPSALPPPAPIAWQIPLAATLAAPFEALVDTSESLPFRPPNEADESLPPSTDPDRVETTNRPLRLTEPGGTAGIDVGETLPPTSAPPAPSLPFRRGGPDAPHLPPGESPARASNQVATRVRPGDIDVGETLPPTSAPPVPSLPFHVGETLPPTSAPPAPSLPFRRGGPDAPHLSPGESPARASSQVAIRVRPGDTLGTTAAASASAQKFGHAGGSAASEDFDPEATIAPGRLVPRGPALPFGPPGSASAQGPRLGVLESPKFGPRLPLGEQLGETTGPIQAPKGPVIPFRPPVEGHRARPSPPPPPPVQVQPTPHAVVAEPHNVLSLAQYASLCAELAVFPEETEGTFWRYGLDTDEKRSAVDAAWKERLRREPAEYEAWQELYRRYHAYWTEQGTSPAG